MRNSRWMRNGVAVVVALGICFFLGNRKTMTRAGEDTAKLSAQPQKPTSPPEKEGSEAAISARLSLPLEYPPARQADHADEYHGQQIADPYRWLEDTNGADTLVWVALQKHLSDTFLREIPQRAWIAQRLKTLWNFERYGLPFKRGDRYFYSHNNGLQEQSILYSTDVNFENRRVLLDPNTLSPDGAVSLTSYSVSEDGKLLAYGLSHAGSDWQEWKVRGVESGDDLPDHLQWIKFSGVSWLPNASGFYYSRYAEPEADGKLKDANYYQKLYFHKIGTKQAEDVLVYARGDEKEWGFSPRVTEDGRYLIIHVWQGAGRKNNVFYQDLSRPDSAVVELIQGFKAKYDFVDSDGSRFWLLTNDDAPNGRLVEIDVAQEADRGNAQAPDQPPVMQTVIPAGDHVLRDVHRVGDQFLSTYLEHACSVVRRFDLAGKSLGLLELPGLGTLSGLSGRAKSNEAFYGFTSFTRPTTIFRYDVATQKFDIWKQPILAFDPERYETRQVFVESTGGVKIPLFLVHKRGLKPNGKLPTLLYGYGGFNISITPSFSVASQVWMEMGGVNAVAVLRGGGEYGTAWHEAGQKAQKQNVFDDFIACAQWLIENRYTRPRQLAISGRSNGGLLVGACLTQRPELFGAALPAVGVMDMLRFHKFTIGWAWVGEYGSADNPEDFASLLAYSPLHNIKPGAKYPPTLVSTADHDDRVVPAHSYKFAAAMQAAQAGDAPVLIRIETSAGHGAGTPISKLIDEAADRLAFLAHFLDVPTPTANAEEGSE